MKGRTQESPTRAAGLKLKLKLKNYGKLVITKLLEY